MPDHDAAFETTVLFFAVVAGVLIVALLIGGVLYWRERFKAWNASQKPATEPRVSKQSPALPNELLEEEERLESAMLFAAMQLENAFADVGTACLTLSESPNMRHDTICHALKLITANSGLAHNALQLPEGMRQNIVQELGNILNARGAPNDPRTAEVHRLLTQLLEHAVVFLNAAEALERHRSTYIRYR